MTYEKAVELVFNWQNQPSSDNFSSLLFTLRAKADPENQVKLRNGFPTEMEAWEDWYSSPDPNLFFAVHNLHEESITDKFTSEFFQNNFSIEKRAKMVCILNSWDTPKALGIGRKLTHEEIGPVFAALRETVTHEHWLRYWNDRSIPWGEIE